MITICYAFLYFNLNEKIWNTQHIVKSYFKIEVCIKTSNPTDDDTGDCVPSSAIDKCDVLSSYKPKDARRRRAIISKQITKDPGSNGSTGNSAQISIDWSHCAETIIDENGIVTCTQFKQAGSNANIVSLSFLTGAIISALH